MCPRIYYLRNGNIEHINQGRKSYSYSTINRYKCNKGMIIIGLGNKNPFKMMRTKRTIFDKKKKLYSDWTIINNSVSMHDFQFVNI